MKWEDYIEWKEYEAMGRDVEPEEPRIFWIYWESDKEWCEDIEDIEAESEEEARAEFEWRLDTGRLNVPEDAVITEIKEVEKCGMWGVVFA